MISCSTSSKIASGDRDGLSYEKAIIAKSISFEYEWIKENFPGSQTQRQMLSVHKRKHYDIVTIKKPDEETKDIYFDISSFFGKF